MNVRLILQILNEPFLIDPNRALNYGPLLLSIIKGEKLPDTDWGKERGENKSYIMGPDEGDVYYDYQDMNIPEGSTAIIPIRGEMMKYPEMCGPKGTLEITNDVIMADNNPNISGILLIIDSPGGMVTQTDLLAEAVKNAVTPVVAYVEGMAASAAYWVASSAGRIIASSDIDQIGSIGTMCSFADLQPYYEELGVKFYEILATASKNKNKYMREIRNGNDDNYRKEVLDPINNKFMNAIKENRAGVDDKVLNGDIYFAKDALKNGLIDEIGSIDYALSELQKMGVKNEINNQNKNTMNIKFKEAWTSIRSLFKFESAKENETEEMVNAEQTIDNLQVELNARQTSIDALKAEADTFKGVQAKAETDLAAVNTQLTTANGRIEELTTELATANDDKSTTLDHLATANARIQELEGENAVLKGSAGDETAVVKLETELASNEDVDAEMAKLGAMSIPERVAYMRTKEAGK